MAGKRARDESGTITYDAVDPIYETVRLPGAVVGVSAGAEVAHRLFGEVGASAGVEEVVHRLFGGVLVEWREAVSLLHHSFRPSVLPTT